MNTTTATPDAQEEPRSAEHHYDAFISYTRSPRDLEEATWLQQALETFPIPADIARAKNRSPKLRPVFRDASDLAATASIRDALRRELWRSRFLIVVCSPRAKNSRWVDEEIREFQALGRGGRILAVLIEGEPTDAFPPALAAMAASQDDKPRPNDVPLDVPLAADLRRHPRTNKRQARRLALLKLVAAIVDCDFDALAKRAAEREARVRRRRLAGALSLLAVLSGAGLYALYQYNQRQLNLALAHYARGVEAETQRNIPLARLHFAKSRALVETPEAAKRYSDVGFTARRSWDAALVGPATPPGQLKRSEIQASIRFSSDGRRVYVSAGDHKVLALDSGSGRQLSTFTLAAPVARLATTAGVDALGVGCQDGTVSVVEPRTGRLRLHTRFPGPVSALAFSADGRGLGVGLESGGMSIIDAEDGVPWFRSPEGVHEVGVDSVAFAPEGGDVIWSMGRWLYTTNVATGKLSLVAPQNDVILGAAWSRGSDPLLAWGGLDGPIQLLRRHDDPAEGRAMVLAGQKRQKATIRDLPGHPGAGVAVMAFLPDGDTLVTGGYDGTIRIWDARSGKLLLVLEGHRGKIDDLAVSPDGKSLATAGSDHRVRMWQLDPDKGIEVWRAKELPRRDPFLAGLGQKQAELLATTRDGSVFVGLRDGSACRCRQGDCKSPCSDTTAGTRERANSWTLNETGDLLGVVVPDLGSTVSALLGKPGVEIFELPGVVKRSKVEIPKLTSAAWWTSNTMVAGDSDGNVQSWDPEHNRPIGTIGARTSAVVSVSTAPSSSAVASLWKDGHFSVWQGSPLKEIFSQHLSSDLGPSSVRLSPDGRTLLVATRGPIGKVMLWSVDTGRPVFEDRLWTRATAFSDDSRTLALGSDVSAEIRLVDTTAGRLISTLRGHRNRILAVAFDPRGNTLYSSGDEQAVRAWPISALRDPAHESGSRLVRLAEESAGLTLAGLEHELAPAPAVSTTGGDAGAIRALPTPIDEALGAISAKLRELTPADEEELRSRKGDENLRVANEITKTLNMCDTVAAKAPDDLRVDRLLASLLTLLGDALLSSEEQNALVAYSRAIEHVRKVVKHRPADTWPILFKAYDHYTSALLGSKHSGRAFDLIRERLDIQTSMVAKRALLVPELATIATLFRKAIVLLADRDRGSKGLELATAMTSFLEAQSKSKPDDRNLVEGLATFYNESAKLAHASSRLELARELLSKAERTWRRCLEMHLKASDSREREIRIGWALALANVAFLDYEAAKRMPRHSPNGGESARSAALGQAREHATSALGQFESLSESGELPGHVARTVESLGLLVGLLRERAMRGRAVVSSP